MKVSVVLYWVIFLVLPLNAVSQSGRVFNSIEEANSVHKDSVYILDLSKHKLTDLPQDITEYTNLRALYLSKNKLTILPFSLSKLNHLEVLDLSKNKIEVFPPVICELVSLKQLFLGRNEMTVIPDCVGELTGLEVLDIWYNQVEGIPETMRNLKKLKSLDIRGVNFSSETKAKIQAIIPWATIEFDVGCDCGG